MVDHEKRKKKISYLLSYGFNKKEVAEILQVSRETITRYAFLLKKEYKENVHEVITGIEDES